MKGIINATEIPRFVKNGATIFVTGITMGGFAEEAILEIEKSFLENGNPKDLTLYFQSGVGDRGKRGLAHLAQEGLLKRAVGGHLLGCGAAMVKMCNENYCGNL